MHSNKYTSQLFRFMLLFGINRFSWVECMENTIAACVGWPDVGARDYDAEEEVQDIEWEIQQFPNMEIALQLAEAISDHRVIKGDKIAITEDELFDLIKQELNWTKIQFNTALKTLLEIRVDMVDEGRKTDHFFVHF